MIARIEGSGGIGSWEKGGECIGSWQKDEGRIGFCGEGEELDLGRRVVGMDWILGEGWGMYWILGGGW